MRTALLYMVFALIQIGSLAKASEGKKPLAKKMTAQQELTYAKKVLQLLSRSSLDIVLYIGFLAETPLNIRKVTKTVFAEKPFSKGSQDTVEHTTTLVSVKRSTIGERLLSFKKREMVWEQVKSFEPSWSQVQKLVYKLYHRTNAQIPLLGYVPPTNQLTKHKDQESA